MPSVNAICSRRSNALEMVGKMIAVALPCASATAFTGSWIASQTKASVSHQPEGRADDDRERGDEQALAQLEEMRAERHPLLAVLLLAVLLPAILHRGHRSQRLLPESASSAAFLSCRRPRRVRGAARRRTSCRVGRGGLGRAGLVLLGTDLALEDLHRLPEATGERRELGGAEEQQDDHEDDQRVPTGEALPHRCSSVSRGYRDDSLPVARAHYPNCLSGRRTAAGRSVVEGRLGLVGNGALTLGVPGQPAAAQSATAARASAGATTVTRPGSPRRGASGRARARGAG